MASEDAGRDYPCASDSDEGTDIENNKNITKLLMTGGVAILTNR